MAHNKGLCGPFKELLNDRAGRHPVHGTGLERECSNPALDEDEYYDPDYDEPYADEL